MKVLSLLIVGLAVVVRAAVAWDEPSGFRDIPWGSPPAIVKEKLPDLNCGQKCYGSLTIGQVRVFTMIEFETGAGMDHVYLSFPSSSFFPIKVAFVERYGEPTARRTETVQNRMGAKYEDEILEWNGEKVVIESREDVRVQSALERRSKRARRIFEGDGARRAISCMFSV